MRRTEKPTAGNYYHVYNRGVNYENIFFTKENWIFFLNLVGEYFTAEYADIIAYCLMPNHYHMLVYLKTDNFGNEVMQPLMVSYTKTINNQEGRVGALFQGPYKARPVRFDGYLLHLSRYIHLNPVTAGLVARPEEWAFSSYREYVGIRNGTLPKMDVILENPVFAGPKNPGVGSFGNLVDDSNTITTDKFHKSAQVAYADYVCSDNDPRAGLVASLLFDE